MIPFANPHAAYLERHQALRDAVGRVLDSGRYILGSEVEAFETAFACWLDLNQVVGVASGTDALELALRGLGIGPGHAVFTVSHTAVATVAAIERAGAVPVLVDIDPEYLVMAPDSLERAIARVRSDQPDLEPRAVIPVHIHGHPCPMEAIGAIARAQGLAVVEDCAQAHGARYQGRKVGTLGTASAFSFYPTKNLGALGDAGAVATPDAGLAEDLRALRQYGWREHYVSAMPGINSRLDPLQAAILSVNLAHLDADNARRQGLAAAYAQGLAGSGLVLPKQAPWAEHVYHLYVVRTPERDALRDFLRQAGVGTAVHYPQAVHQQPAYADRILLDPHGLPVTEAVYREILSLPMFPQLSSGDMERICKAVADWRRAGG